MFIGICAQAQNCVVLDKPDINFIDENGDGIDGDTSNAIFVSETTGNDANSGRIGSPLKSLTMAMALGHATGKDIYIAAGTYTISAPLIMFDGVGLYGYFSPTTWVRNVFNKVVINGPENVIYAHSNTKSSMIQGLEIVASDASGNGKSSHAIFIDSCSGVFQFIGNTIRAGRGSNGIAGAVGFGGASGGDGGNGSQGICDGTAYGAGGTAGFSSCASGGKGGDGGVENQNGKNGFSNNVSAPGGNGGSSGDPGQRGNDGNDGINGVDGASASSNNVLVKFSVNGVAAGNGYDGNDGNNGTSGSGGGGGGGQSCALCNKGSGNGGGGGGGAGCKGTGGKGGIGGGFSVAVFVRDSRVYLENNKIYTNKAGNGGNGGNGGVGGTGGTGGIGPQFCTGEIGGGGYGGDGGDGGHGGGGSGGNGGSSIAIVSAGSSVVNEFGNTYTLGIAGNGGAGGTSQSGINGSIGYNGLSKNFEGSVNSSIADVSGKFCIDDITLIRYKNSNRDAIVRVSFSEASPKELRVSYSMSNGTAVSGTDYISGSGQLSFLPYNSVQYLPITITKEYGDTSTKTFTITLSNIIGSATFEKSTATVTVKPYSGASLSSLDGSTDVREFPNPFSEDLTIYCNNGDVKTTNVNVYNHLGQLIKTLNGKEEGEGLSFTLSREGLSAGVYYYSVVKEGIELAKRPVVFVQ